MGCSQWKEKDESKQNRRQFFVELGKGTGAVGLTNIWPTLPAFGDEPARGRDEYFVATHLVAGSSPIAEPYQPLHGGQFTGEEFPLSPDPLVRYRWQHTDADDTLQYYILRPVAVSTLTPQVFKGL